jgi:hypothetical protein
LEGGKRYTEVDTDCECVLEGERERERKRVEIKISYRLCDTVRKYDGTKYEFDLH